MEQPPGRSSPRDSRSSSPESDTHNLWPVYRGSQAVKYFETLNPAQKYRYLLNIFQSRKEIPASWTSTDQQLSLGDLPLLPWFFRPLPLSCYRFHRYEYTQRSLLTATIFLQRPLMEEEAKAIAHWSAVQDRLHMVDIAASVWGPLLIWCFQGCYRSSSLILSSRSGLFGAATLLLSIPTSMLFLSIPRCKEFMIGLEEEMDDTRLVALKRAVSREYPELYRGSYRAVLLPKSSLKGPSFRNLFWNSSEGYEWQKLKYRASALVDPLQCLGGLDDSQSRPST